jgi:hypothetical protein
MILLIACSTGSFSRMSLTSISDPANANDRMSDSASFSAYRNISRNPDIAATEPETSHSTITRGFSMRFCFQTVMNGMPPQPMFRRSVRRVSNCPRNRRRRVFAYRAASFFAICRTSTRIRSRSRRSRFDSRADFSSSSRNFSVSPFA